MKGIRLILGAVLVSALLAQPLCAMSALQKIFIEATINKWEKINTFQGELVETGLLPDGQELKSLVMIERPALFYSQTMAPEALAGDFFLFDGKNIYAYYARYHYGILLSELQDLIPDTKERRTRRLSRNMMSATKKFHISIKENEKIGGVECACYNFYPKTPGDTPDKNLASYRTWSELDYLLPIKTEFYNIRNETAYRYVYPSYQINQPLDKSLIPKGFPPGTSTSVWDFNDPALTWSQVTAAMNFPVSRINGLSQLDKKWQLKKIIKARGIVPAAALLYDNGTNFLLLTQFKDYDINPDTERGLLVSKPTPETRLNFFGETVMLSWNANGVIYSLMGDLPYFTMLEIVGLVGG